jgi:arabinogalactan endo-1,4-beta-galactosidase
VGSGGRAGGGGGGGASGGGGGRAVTIGASFFIGADVTDQEPQPAATRANLLTILKEHGFNYVRLRTFVDPRAFDGYDKQNGWGAIDPTVAFGKQVKDAGMGLLIYFHYSNNWADPAKQCVPVAWQGIATIAALAATVHDYTRDAVQKLVAGGARPDMVQIGNESTPGVLIHRCDGGGIPMAGVAGINLGTFNWAPTTRGFWNDPNHDLLRLSGSTYTVQPDMAVYDQMKIDYAARL